MSVILYWVLSFATLASAGAARAQNVTITPSPLSVPKLGTFVAGTTNSNYTLDASTGTVTRTSGNAFPASRTGSANTVTITCTSCNGSAGNRTVNVSVTGGAPSGRFSLTNFTRSDTTFTAGSTVTGSASGFPLTLRVVFPSGSGTKRLTFRLGMAFQLASTGGTGSRTFNYTIVAARLNP